MRVLWFVNAPTSEIAEYLLDRKLNNAGWIDSLYRRFSAICESEPGVLELGVVFRWNVKNVIKQKLHNTQYYVVPNQSSLSEKIVNNLFSKVYSDKRIKNYLEIVEEFKPDVIHIFGTENDFGLIQEYTECPCVIQMQGVINYIAVYYFHAITPFKIFINSKLRGLITGSSYYHTFARFKKQIILEQKIFKLTNNVCGFTDFDRRVASILSNKLNYHYVPVMLRAPFYNNEWVLPQKDVFRIISVINPQTYKGLETIYRISNFLNSNFPGRYEFVVAGITERSEINRLIRKTLDKEIVKNNTILFKGNLDSETLVKELLESHILIHPSLCDTSPNSICEAMVLGMPVISTNVGGIPTIIKDGETGFLVQNMDFLSFAYHIHYLSENPQKAVYVGANAKKVASERHSENFITEATLKMYDTISRK